MNLQSIVNPYAATINPNFIGTLMASNGDVNEGDAEVTGSISGTVLTVSAVASGALAVNSVLSSDLIQPPCLVVAPLSVSLDGTGTYTISLPQVVASGAISATGTGKRIPQFVRTDGLTMQVQAVSGQDLAHVDGLNLQGVYRTVYMNGTIMGADRPGVNGGDLLLMPTHLANTGDTMDTWLVKQVVEPWDTGGWSKVIAVLQEDVQSQ